MGKISEYVARRHFSIGSDGLICVCKSDVADFKMRMFNADQSEGKMCGNGIRCVSKFVYDKGLTDKTQIAIETLSGVKVIDVKVEEGKVVSAKVDMGKPIFKTTEIPMISDHYVFVDQGLAMDKVQLEVYNGTAISMGNPHFVTFVEDVDALVQEMENTSDETVRGFIEQVLFKLNEHTTSFKQQFEAFERVNPFSLSQIK